MIDGFRVLGLIPARGGSKGLPRKNVLDLCGKPMIAWTIEAALASRHMDRVILSSDDPEIMQTATGYGCDVPYQRPNHLATDEATTIDVALHAADTLPEFNVLVILQPTSPLRTAEDIDATLEQLFARRAPSCVSVTEPEKSPYWSYGIDPKGRIDPLIDASLARRRRQDLPTAYVLNGAVYAAHIDWLREQRAFVGPGTVAHVMPHGRSLDVDTLVDLKISSLLLQERLHTPALKRVVSG